MSQRGRLRACRCRFSSRTEHTRRLRPFLRKYGDDIPETDVHKGTREGNLSRWHTVCDCKKHNEIVGAMRWEKSDWYLCTLKNAAVKEELRGRGIGTQVYHGAAQKALRNKACLVLAADVTHTNKPSIRLLEKQGFRTVNRFCWGKGEKPADILHYVKLPPKGRKKGRC